MMSRLPNFNLVSQPWISVRTLTDEVREVSLLDAFQDAEQFRGLAGEMASQDAAILRLQLAVALAATRPNYVRNQHECLDLWEEFASPGGFPVDVIEEYLSQFHERFELFSPVAPFMQVADLHTGSGRASGLTKIIAELPDGHQYFTTRAGANAESLSFAEAARWLVHCQQFDPAGIKTGAVGDERVKGGKGYSFGYPAWAGNLGVVYAEGNNLAQTLLLNLPLIFAGPDDLPVWERPPQTAAADAGHPAPKGPADAFTWQSRRIRLFPEDGRVIDVQISNGDRLPPHNLHEIEPMSAWRHSRNQSKAGNEVLMPVRHDSSRLIWQGLAPLLIPNETQGSRSRPPAVVNWMGSLIGDELISPSTRVALRTVGVEYGSNNSVIDAVVDDALLAPVVALVDPVLRQTATDGVSRASGAVLALVRLSRDLAIAAGSKRDDPQQKASEQRAFELGYAALDGPYRGWLATLTDPEQATSALDTWGAQIRNEVKRLGQDMVTAAGPDAWQGRQIAVQRKGQPETNILMDSARAHLHFLAAVNKATGAATTNDKKEA